MSKSFTNGTGKLTRRSDSNLGIEDLIDLEDGSDDDKDMTLVRQPQTGFHMGTSRRVNGTSERNNSKNKKSFGLFQNKSKSENENSNSGKRQEQQCGQSASSQPRDMSDTKKILSHWNSGVEKGMKIFQYGFAKAKWEEQKKTEDNDHRNGGKNPDFRGSSFESKSSATIQQSLQNVMTLKSHLDAAQIFSTLAQGAETSFLSTKLTKKEPHKEPEPPQYNPPPPPPQQPVAEKVNSLEKFLELDHGEFEFIDEGSTLTRNSSPPPSSKNLSISSLASEIFQELGQSTLSDDRSVDSTSRFRHHNHRRRRNLSTASMSAVPPYESTSVEYYNDTTQPTWHESKNVEIKSDQNGDSKHRQRRHRNLSTASMSASLMVTEPRKEVVEKIIPKTDSQLVASLLEDQTLWLRHHKKLRRRQPLQPWIPSNKWQLQPRMQSQDLVAGLQVTDQHAVLRRCSSLTQTNVEDLQGTPNYSQDNGSPRLSSPVTTSKGIRFLYNGKYRSPISNTEQQQQHPQPSILNNNQFHEDRRTPGVSSMSNNTPCQPTQSPWVVSNNLSTFARRRRSSSTSLHTYQDDTDDNGTYNNNNIKHSSHNGEITADHR